MQYFMGGVVIWACFMVVLQLLHIMRLLQNILLALQ
jgi:hypothetical protein